MVVGSSLLLASRASRGAAAATSRHRTKTTYFLLYYNYTDFGRPRASRREGLSSLLLAPWLPRPAPFGNKKERPWRKRVAPSSGGSSLLSVYLGWCYALALRTSESAQRKAQKGRRRTKGALAKAKASTSTPPTALGRPARTFRDTRRLGRGRL